MTAFPSMTPTPKSEPTMSAPMSAEEAAQQLASALYKKGMSVIGHGATWEELTNEIAKHVRSVRSAARAEALEEAARLADDWDVRSDGHLIGRAIRALAQSPTTGEVTHEQLREKATDG